MDWLDYYLIDRVYFDVFLHKCFWFFVFLIFILFFVFDDENNELIYGSLPLNKVNRKLNRNLGKYAKD